MRIKDDPSQRFGAKRGSLCHIMINGHQYEAYIGETVATVMFANNLFPTPAKHANQPGLSGFYCGIGLCYGCQLMVDGRLRRACVTPIQPEMIIVTSLDTEK